MLMDFKFTMIVPECTEFYILRFIKERVQGECGDGWGYIVCEDPVETAHNFIKQDLERLYIQSEKLDCVSVCEKYDQTAWIFTTKQPDDDDLKINDFIFIIE